MSELTESRRTDYFTMILGLYVFTGDVTSARKTKIRSILKLPNHPKYHASFE